MNQIEDEKTRKMYQKTHGLTLPGEQKVRDYNWPVDKHKHVFGKPEHMEIDGCKKSLRPDILLNDYPATKLGDKRLEDFRQATSHMVGKSKFKGSLRNDLPEDFSFGSKSMKENAWNVGKCLNGDEESLTDKMLESDVDLGKSCLYRMKNPKCYPVHSNYYKTFGVCSVRSDLKEPERRSVSDLNVSFINIKKLFF
jgi:hypothetical protein